MPAENPRGTMSAIHASPRSSTRSASLGLASTPVTVNDGFNPDVDGTVLTVVTQPDGKLLVGGQFTAVGGVSRSNLARLNADGSVDLYIQKDSPGADKEANWLPAPAGKFILMMRMYWPDESPPSIIDGTWSPPAAIKAS